MSGTVPYFDMYRAGSGIGQFVKVNEQRNIVAVLSIKQAHIVRCNIIEPADSDAAVDRCRDTSLNPPAIHSPNSGNREGIPADIIELRIGRMIGIELRQSSNIYGYETAVRNMIGTGVMNTVELTDTRLFISIITIVIIIWPHLLIFARLAQPWHETDHKECDAAILVSLTNQITVSYGNIFNLLASSRECP